MSCPDFEALVREGGGDHVAHCESCRALLDAWADVDAVLTAGLSGVSAPPNLAAAVRARLAKAQPERKPSPVPEILDFIGWAAVLATMAIVLPRFLPLLTDLLSAYA